MPRKKRKRCQFCETLFSPDPRVGPRQYACSRPECQAARQVSNHQRWVEAHPDCYQGRSAKHARYRAEIAAGLRVPESRPSRGVGDHPEQEAISTQVPQGESVEPTLRSVAEQEETLTQGLIFQALVASLPAPLEPPEQEEMERRQAAWQDLVRRLAERSRPAALTAAS